MAPLCSIYLCLRPDMSRALEQDLCRTECARSSMLASWFSPAYDKGLKPEQLGELFRSRLLIARTKPVSPRY
jgi:hypothetical protein